MKLFSVFGKNKKVQLSEEDIKWNKMWELWTEDKAESPYAELMTYQSEVNNGGHSQYFFNTSNTGDLNAEMAVLESVLPYELWDNLQKAYRAYLLSEENEEDEEAEKVLAQCDDVFYKNENVITELLKNHANETDI